jgi:hypothetical protein
VTTLATAARELSGELGVIGEGEIFGRWLEEEIKWILHRHLDDKVDFDVQPRRWLGEHQAGKVICLRILLPIDEMLHRADIQAVGEDLGSAVGRGSQSNHMGSVSHRSVVLIAGTVVERDVDRHKFCHPVSNNGADFG